MPLQWRHNDHDCASNHQPRGCLLNRLFRRTSKKTSKLRVTGLCVENSPGPVNSPHKGPVTRKMFPFDDVIMGDIITLTVFLAIQIIACVACCTNPGLGAFLTRWSTAWKSISNSLSNSRKSVPLSSTSIWPRQIQTTMQQRLLFLEYSNWLTNQ